MIKAIRKWLGYDGREYVVRMWPGWRDCPAFHVDEEVMHLRNARKAARHHLRTSRYARAKLYLKK